MESGHIYEGGFSGPQMHGAGKILYTDGKVFIGSFQEDVKHGMGNLFDIQKGEKYNEEW